MEATLEVELRRWGGKEPVVQQMMLTIRDPNRAIELPEIPREGQFIYRNSVAVERSADEVILTLMPSSDIEHFPVLRWFYLLVGIEVKQICNLLVKKGGIQQNLHGSEREIQRAGLDLPLTTIDRISAMLIGWSENFGD